VAHTSGRAESSSGTELGVVLTGEIRKGSTLMDDHESTEKAPAPQGVSGAGPGPKIEDRGDEPGGSVIPWAERVEREIDKVFVGQRALVRGLLTALLAEGHVLIESVPGLGKTLLVRALGRVLGCAFKRIQFTPDLMPSDITGSPIYDERQADFRFRPGPVFTQLLLADEINRAPAKTHSALLEIMQENRVTIDGVIYPIERPFLVMATQNPIESEGTYNLPEAQLDRFLFKLVIGYPTAAEETEILKLHTRSDVSDQALAAQLQVITSPAEVRAMQARCSTVLVDDNVLGYIAALVRKTREWPTFSLGASPRAGVAILRGARALAALEGRDFTLPDDVQEVVLPALRHRVLLAPEAEVEGRSSDDLLAELVQSVEVPIR
jgi:MoxR-like ATPase